MISTMTLLPGGAMAHNEDISPEAFQTGFRPAWVRGIDVTAGEIMDVGSVVAGESRSATAPSLVDIFFEVPAPPGAEYEVYWVDFWSVSVWDLTHRSGTFPKRFYSTRLMPDKYWVRTLGWTGSAWEEIQNWTPADFTAHPVRLDWPRKFWFPDSGWTGPNPEWPHEVESAYYRLYRYRIFDSGAMAGMGNIKVDGEGYTFFGIPGIYSYGVDGGWDPNFVFVWPPLPWESFSVQPPTLVGAP